MKLLKPDHRRTIDIPGVPGPVRRPVDIDQTKTGFTTLRTLRIYRFDAGAVIEGHAEEDEVVIVVLSGAIHLTLMEHDAAVESSQTATVSAADGRGNQPCAAYLPPGAAYRLTVQTNADVAYARATPATGPKPAFFTPKPEANHVVWEEGKYPKLLRIRLLRIEASDDQLAHTLREAEDGNHETLLHLTTTPEQGSATIAGPNHDPQPLTSWDTVALSPGEHPTLHLAKNATAQLLLIQT